MSTKPLYQQEQQSWYFFQLKSTVELAKFIIQHPHQFFHSHPHHRRLRSLSISQIFPTHSKFLTRIHSDPH
ncbi:hypothetical protein BVRB_4g085550 [Beta vulgaris subsp. vulgaris]|nr:hypothetical protein BVRB_4g085550 [Beta vulgaris subsp. vulgaris]